LLLDIIIKKLGGSGCLNFEFITSFDSSLKDFIDFQLHQRVYGLILVTNNDNEITDDSLKVFKDKFPYEIVIKPLRSSSNEELINDELKDLAKTIIHSMSELYADLSVRPALPSPCGIEEYSGTSSVSYKSKMRLSGRVQKLQADFHTLTGCYSDAVACYVSANEDAKAVGDSVWSAAAQEGFHVALCLQNEVIFGVQIKSYSLY
jgi:hypothetical protein